MSAPRRPRGGQPNNAARNSVIRASRTAKAKSTRTKHVQAERKGKRIRTPVPSSADRTEGWHTHERLRQDKSVVEVIDQLKRKMLSDSAVMDRLRAEWRKFADILEPKGRNDTELVDAKLDHLLWQIAHIPSDWRGKREPWKQAHRRRTALAKALRRLARQVAKDPDLGTFYLCCKGYAYGGLSEDLIEEGYVSFADLLNTEAAGVEVLITPGLSLRPVRDQKMHRVTEDDLRASHVDRKMDLPGYALREIFGLLEPCSSGAPNKETEIIAGVLLRRTIKPGTVTQIRKKERRRYHREE